MAIKTQAYEENGVVLSKKSISVGDEITLIYDGLLLKSGADRIFAHIGYGDEWDEKAFIPMKKEDNAFKATFIVAVPGVLNISLKDSANNWDNNSSQNYSFPVKQKARASKASKTEKAGEVSKAEKKAKTEKKVKTDGIKPKRVPKKVENK